MISVVVPVFNIDCYIARCIKSVLKQTFSDWQLILIDDGSEDDSGNICDDYAGQDSRIEVIHTTNGGVSRARNLGLMKARGVYITFVDGDDWIEESFLYNLWTTVQEVNVDIVLSGHVNDYGDVVDNPFLKKRQRMLNKKDALYELLACRLFCWSPFSKLYRTSLLKGKGFLEDISLGEDMLFNWNVFNSGRTFIYTPHAQYHYCFRTSSVTNKRITIDQLSVLDVKRCIYIDARKISFRLFLLARCLYVVENVGLGRRIIQAEDDINFEWVLSRIHQCARKNIYYVVAFYSLKVLSVRSRLGIIYFSLPNRVRNKFRKYIYKNH